MNVKHLHGRVSDMKKAFVFLLMVLGIAAIVIVAHNVNRKQEINDPFYSFYSDEKIESVSLEGTIRAVSSIPDPEKNDYDNCLYALFVELDSVLSDMPPNSNIHSEIIINVPIVKDRQIVEDNIFQVGDKISCICAEYDSMPQKIQEIQISDDIQSYEHQQYYSMMTRSVSAFQENGNKNFAKKEISILPVRTLPKDENAAKLRKDRIDMEISRIEDELKKHGGSFEAWKEEYFIATEKYRDLSKDQWEGWINDSYFSAGGEESSYNTEEYIKTMLPYKEYFEKNNIDLIIVRIPAKGDFASCVLASDDFLDNPLWVEHYYKCLKADIEIVDPMLSMWEHRFDLPLFYYYNSSSEKHPFEGTHFYCSEVLAEVLSRYQYETSEGVFALNRVSHNGKESKFFYPPGNPKFSPQDHIQYYQVKYQDEPLTNLQRITGSPFLFASNSFFGYYLAKDLALPYYVAYRLKTLPDWYYQDGNTKILRNIVSKPELLASRKAILFVGKPGMWGTIPTPSLPQYVSDGPKTICFEKDIEMNPDSIRIVDKEQDHVTIKKQHLEFRNKGKKSVSFLINIPSIPNKTTCMLRFDFLKNTSCEVSVSDPDNDDMIDFDFFAGGDNVKYDLFVPMKEKEQTVKIKIDPWYDTSSTTVLKNIEIWSY